MTGGKSYFLENSEKCVLYIPIGVARTPKKVRT